MELEPLFDFGTLPPPTTTTTTTPISTIIDLSPYYLTPQTKVAKMLNLSTSALSKRWRIASQGKRMWPYRKVIKLDEQIRAGKGDIKKLQRKRAKLMFPVFIKIGK